MNKALRRFSEPFAQLGLLNDAVGIANFLASHASRNPSSSTPYLPQPTP